MGSNDRTASNIQEPPSTKLSAMASNLELLHEEHAEKKQMCTTSIRSSDCRRFDECAALTPDGHEPIPPPVIPSSAFNPRPVVAPLRFGRPNEICIFFQNGVCK